jgi:hypothetical protein
VAIPEGIEMAGSYNHCVKTDGEKDLGKLLVPQELCSMLECMSGDVYEAVEEMYGMIWYLAENYARSLEAAQGEDEGVHSTAGMVEDARQHYQEGLALSPGIGARNDPEDD